MLNGPLYQEDDGDSGGVGQAASDAADSFPDSPPSATTPCSPTPMGPGGSGKPVGPAASAGWTQDQIKANLDSCDGGTNAWANGKAGNGGKDPTIVEGSSVIGTGASVDHTTGVITIDPGKDLCQAKQYAVMELTNLGHTADFNKVRGPDCQSGTLSRDDFIRANEKLEYDGVHNVLTAFDACKAKWHCGDTATSVMDGFRGATDFDDYFNHYLAQNHKDYYGTMWDNSCKAAWDAKHPSPAPAPGVTPPSPPPPGSPAPDASGGNGGDGGGSDVLSDD